MELCVFGRLTRALGAAILLGFVAAVDRWVEVGPTGAVRGGQMRD